MNRGTIRTKARRKLDELSEKFWEDDDLNDYINEGYYQYWQWLIDAAHPATWKESLLSIVASSRTIAVPSDYVKTRLLEKILTAGGSQPLVYKERFDNLQYLSSVSGDAFIPQYSFASQNILLNPTPLASEPNSLRLTHIYLPAELTDDAQSPDPGFNPLYHNMLVMYVVVAAKEKEEAMGLGGGPADKIQAKLNEMEQIFKSNAETESLQRQHTEPFSTDGYAMFYP